MTASRTGDVLGYARVSIADQAAAGQRDRLEEAGAVRVFTDVVSGAAAERRELLETVEELKARGIHLASLEERIDTSSAAGWAVRRSIRRRRRRCASWSRPA